MTNHQTSEIIVINKYVGSVNEYKAYGIMHFCLLVINDKVSLLVYMEGSLRSMGNDFSTGGV